MAMNGNLIFFSNIVSGNVFVNFSYVVYVRYLAAQAIFFDIFVPFHLTLYALNYVRYSKFDVQHQPWYWHYRNSAVMEK